MSILYPYVLGTGVTARHPGSGNAWDLCMWRSAEIAVRCRGAVGSQRGVSKRAALQLSITGDFQLTARRSKEGYFKFQWHLKGRGIQVVQHALSGSGHVWKQVFSNCKEEAPLFFIYGLVKVRQWPLLDRKLEFWKHCPSPLLFYQAGLCWDHGTDLWLRKWKSSFKWCAQIRNQVIVGPISHLSLSAHGEKEGWLF